MADLKTYLGISDTDIKSVSGLPANDTKTILGSKLNLCDEYKAIYNTMTVKPPVKLALAQNEFVEREIASGRWAKIDHLVIRESHDPTAALINWKSPDKKETVSGNPFWYPMVGYMPDGVDDFINSGFNPTLATNFKLTNSFYGCYFHTPMLNHSIGGYTTGKVTALCANVNDDGFAGAYVHAKNTYSAPAESSIDKGFIFATRDGANSLQLYCNKTRYTGTTASTGLADLNFYTLGGINGNNVLKNTNTSLISMVVYGAFLTEQEIGDFQDSYSILQAVAEQVKHERFTAIDIASKKQLTIPTYVAGNNEVVHPAVVDCGANWNGYRYWMAITPYPETDNQYENPEIYCSDDGETWIVPDGLTNPVVPSPEGIAYNADPFLFFENNKMYLGWSVNDQEPGPATYLMESSDGVTWTNKTEIANAALYGGIYCAIGSLVKVGSTYYLYYTADSGITIRVSSTNIYGPYSNIEAVSITVPDGYKKNHTSVKYYNGKFYMIVPVLLEENSGPCDYVYFARSNDGLTFTRSEYPILQKTESWEHKYYMTVFENIGNKLKLFYIYYTSTGDWYLASADFYIND